MLESFHMDQMCKNKTFLPFILFSVKFFWVFLKMISLRACLLLKNLNVEHSFLWRVCLWGGRQHFNFYQIKFVLLNFSGKLIQSFEKRSKKIGRSLVDTSSTKNAKYLTMWYLRLGDIVIRNNSSIWYLCLGSIVIRNNSLIITFLRPQLYLNLCLLVSSKKSWNTFKSRIFFGFFSRQKLHLPAFVVILFFLQWKLSSLPNVKNFIQIKS